MLHKKLAPLALVLAFAGVHSAVAAEDYRFVCVNTSPLAGTYDVDVVVFSILSNNPEWNSIQVIPYAVGSKDAIYEVLGDTPSRTRSSRSNGRLTVRTRSGLSVSIDLARPTTMPRNPNIQIHEDLSEAYEGTLLVDDGSDFEGEVDLTCALMGD